MVSRAVKEKVEKLTTTEKNLEWLAAITRVHFRIGAILELDKIARIYLRELIDMVGCDVCAIMRIELDKARILAERGLTKTIGQRELSTDMPVIKHVIKTKQAVFTGDLLNSHADSYIPHGFSIGSLICAPLIANNDVRGILYLDSTKKTTFNEEDVEFSGLLAAEISVAFEQSFEYSHFRNIFIRDGLTGCLNRSKFDLDIVAEVATAQEYKEQLSLLVVSIDWLSNYYDFYGHEKGDALLKEVVDILTSNIRSYEKIYRCGREEFAILMLDAGRERASSAARRLQKTIAQTQFEGERESQPNGKITVSIGVATFSSNGDQWDKLIEAANSALCRAKESGRNQVCVFNSEE
ncbi:sensor domain-containing diguanylate cyclase [Chloroflexota bacterium]